MALVLHHLLLVLEHLLLLGPSSRHILRLLLQVAAAAWLFDWLFLQVAAARARHALLQPRVRQ